MKNPVDWAKLQAAAYVTWPFLVGAAFWLGRIVTKLEARLVKAESQVDSLVTRHMPAVHRALSEIRGLLTSRR